MERDCTFAERLKQGLELAGLRAADLSRLTGISRSSISHYLKGDWEGKQDAVYSISRVLGISEAWLMGFDVPRERNDALDPSQRIQFPEPRITEDVVTFPVIGEVAAGFEHIAAEDWSGDTVDIPTAYLHGRPKSDYMVLTVTGSSMYPLYLEGDKVLVLKQPTLNRSGDIGLIRYDGENATLKKVEFVDGEDWMKLLPLNPEYPPRTITGADLEQCSVIGIPRLVIREIEQ